jgi:nitrile hydratase accessory protein
MFGEPWHAQALAIADLLVTRGVVSPARWAETLGAEIKTLHAAHDDRETYFRAVLAALERVVTENGAVTHAELDEREEQWERAYLRTPHGKPVELAAGMKPV